MVVSYTYDAFGNILSSTGTATTGDGKLLKEENPFRYAGYFYDEETDYYYLQARYYDAGTGRFISRDPVDNINLYYYCDNDPVNLVDPDGNKPVMPSYGGKLKDQAGFSEYNSINDTDLLARAIYSEAGGESFAGKLALAYVIKNRIAKNSSEFGGKKLRNILLRAWQVEGLKTSSARAPKTSSQAWKDSLNIAIKFINNQLKPGDNPIGKALWWNTREAYRAHLDSKGNYKFGGGSPRKVIEKYTIGNHIFFRVQGY